MTADHRVALVVNPAATRTTPQLQARIARALAPFGLT
jgi:hypothetical protein